MSTETDPRQALRRLVYTHRTQTATARHLGISASYLSDMLAGKRDVSEPILRVLGLRRAVVTMKREKPSAG